MTKDDFYVGRSVYVLQVLNCSKKPLEERITEVKVKSVGRKYITVDFWGDMKFDIANNFRQVTSYSPHYRLYLTREEIEYEHERFNNIDFVEKSFRWYAGITKKLSDEDLATVISIIKKYI